VRCALSGFARPSRGYAPRRSSNRRSDRRGHPWAAVSRGVASQGVRWGSRVRASAHAPCGRCPPRSWWTCRPARSWSSSCPRAGASGGLYAVRCVGPC
jgi:hypothetical protein